jgi:hypothetical protein
MEKKYARAFGMKDSVDNIWMRNGGNGTCTKLISGELEVSKNVTSSMTLMIARLKVIFSCTHEDWTYIFIVGEPTYRVCLNPNSNCNR